MRGRLQPRHLALAILASVFWGCDGQPPREQKLSSNDSIHSDLARLGRILRWDSLAPVTASYRIVVHSHDDSRVPGPTDWSLEAILRYDTATFAELERRMGSDAGADSVHAGDSVWNWLSEADRSALSKAPVRRARDNTVFRVEGCPSGMMRSAPPATLLFWCSTR